MQMHNHHIIPARSIRRVGKDGNDSNGTMREIADIATLGGGLFTKEHSIMFKYAVYIIAKAPVRLIALLPL